MHHCRYDWNFSPNCLTCHLAFLVFAAPPRPLSSARCTGVNVLLVKKRASWCDECEARFDGVKVDVITEMTSSKKVSKWKANSWVLLAQPNKLRDREVGIALLTGGRKRKWPGRNKSGNVSVSGVQNWIWVFYLFVVFVEGNVTVTHPAASFFCSFCNYCSNIMQYGRFVHVASEEPKKMYLALAYSQAHTIQHSEHWTRYILRAWRLYCWKTAVLSLTMKFIWRQT